MSYKQLFYDQLGQAIALAASLFKDTTDKQGRPYILHCLRVMNDVGDDPEVQVIAVLHDVIEDFPDEYDLIRLTTELSLTHRQQMALIKLTHFSQRTSYIDYIHDIATNLDAKRVKLADLRDNSNITRLKGLRKKDFDRLEKYHQAYVYLSE
jgi:(p)ppGpp synthase/HD superfamily hydrolase